MLSAAQRDAYERDGFIVVPDVFSPAEIDELRRVTDEFVRNAAAVTANDEVYDLEDTHSRDEPRVRRLKAPHLIHPAYFRASRNGQVVAVLKELWGSVRFDTGKLNMKAAGYGAPVEWHQGWSIARTGRCLSCRAATKGRSMTIMGEMGGFAARSIPSAATSIFRARCRVSAKRDR